MIKIDGSYGEGGGQILRSTLSLSAILGKEVEIFNIRAGRKKPGLQPQHLTGVRAVAEICNGKIEGDSLLSQKIAFFPGKIQPGNFEFDVTKVKASAGSTGMIFQQVAPVLAFAPGESKLTLKGGTHTEMAPPIDYLQNVFLPTVAQMGFKAKLEIERWGWYPIGQGIVISEIKPIKGKLKALELNDRGKLKRIFGLSLVSRLPLSIAEREREQAKIRLKELQLEKLFDCEIKSVPSLGPGNAFLIFAEFENCLAGFNSLGKIGKRAEQVANEAVEEFFKFYLSGAAVDKHLGDQLILYLALAEGKSTICVQEITSHLTTNIWVMEQFLPVKFEIQQKIIMVEGIGFERQNRN